MSNPFGTLRRSSADGPVKYPLWLSKLRDSKWKNMPLPAFAALVVSISDKQALVPKSEYVPTDPCKLAAFVSFVVRIGGVPCGRVIDVEMEHVRNGKAHEIIASRLPSAAYDGALFGGKSVLNALDVAKRIALAATDYNEFARSGGPGSIAAATFVDLSLDATGPAASAASVSFACGASHDGCISAGRSGCPVGADGGSNSTSAVAPPGAVYRRNRVDGFDVDRDPLERIATAPRKGSAARSHSVKSRTALSDVPMYADHTQHTADSTLGESTPPSSRPVAPQFAEPKRPNEAATASAAAAVAESKGKENTRELPTPLASMRPAARASGGSPVAPEAAAPAVRAKQEESLSPNGLPETTVGAKRPDTKQAVPQHKIHAAADQTTRQVPSYKVHDIFQATATGGGAARVSKPDGKMQTALPGSARHPPLSQDRAVSVDECSSSSSGSDVPDVSDVDGEDGKRGYGGIGNFMASDDRASDTERSPSPRFVDTPRSTSPISEHDGDDCGDVTASVNKGAPAAPAQAPAPARINGSEELDEESELIDMGDVVDIITEFAEEMIGSGDQRLSAEPARRFIPRPNSPGVVLPSTSENRREQEVPYPPMAVPISFDRRPRASVIDPLPKKVIEKTTPRAATVPAESIKPTPTAVPLASRKPKASARAHAPAPAPDPAVALSLVASPATVAVPAPAIAVAVSTPLPSSSSRSPLSSLSLESSGSAAQPIRKNNESLIAAIRMAAAATKNPVMFIKKFSAREIPNTISDPSQAENTSTVHLVADAMGIGSNFKYPSAAQGDSLESYIKRSMPTALRVAFAETYGDGSFSAPKRLQGEKEGEYERRFYADLDSASAAIASSGADKKLRDPTNFSRRLGESEIVSAAKRLSAWAAENEAAGPKNRF